ncbi:glycosyltransferase family 4 protein [Antarcticirhabdus aurantiaca]|uniref:Glycosyltransferase family 1 protein n=1 Tax=Antarcticirhabdus aurantiaca TaxID=2606717 RepID=A0ACD4NR80_9HYPH|nr:glycosyltransferase family 1 protein [Antarcticirhabdus aurantiaca]WAJ29165.1 glycosyltransferase family 1 protein [Jeongeuplla avenae]
MTRRVIDLAINGRFISQKITGVQRVARELVREIDHIVTEGDDRFRVQLICEPAPDLGALALRSIDVVEAPGAKGWVWEQFVLPFAAPKSSLLCLGNTAPLLSMVRRQPVGVMIHDLSYRQFPASYRKRYRIFHSLILPTLMRRADPIFTVSKTERNALSDVAPASRHKLVVAQNGGWRRSREGDELGEDPVAQELPANFVAYVGSLSLRKNFAGLRDLAVRLAREDGIDFVFVGTAGRILTPVDMKLPDDVRRHVHFLGQVEDPRLLGAVYRKARCLVFPSFYEASAIPPLEAMHFGCPVVTSHIPSMVERCGEAAEYCNPYDVASILAATRCVLHDQDRAAELIRLGHERERRFSWRSQAELVLDSIYEAHAPLVGA